MSNANDRAERAKVAEAAHKARQSDAATLEGVEQACADTVAEMATVNFKRVRTFARELSSSSNPDPILARLADSWLKCGEALERRANKMIADKAANVAAANLESKETNSGI